MRLHADVSKAKFILNFVYWVFPKEFELQLSDKKYELKCWIQSVQQGHFETSIFIHPNSH